MAFCAGDLLAEAGVPLSLGRCVHGVHIDHLLVDFNVEFCGGTCMGLAHTFMFWGGILETLPCMMTCTCCFPAMLFQTCIYFRVCLPLALRGGLGGLVGWGLAGAGGGDAGLGRHANGDGWPNLGNLSKSEG